jgi:hypothetical protein
VEKGCLSCDSDAPQVRSAQSDLTRVVKVKCRKTNHRKMRPYCVSVVASQSRWERDSFLYKLISLHLPDYLLFFFKSYLEDCIFTLHLNDDFHPLYPFWSTPGCCAIDYIISPLPVWHAVFSPHSSHFIRRQHSPSIPVILSPADCVKL